MTDDTHDPNCSGCPACSGRDSELKQLATDVQELLGATVFQAARSRAYDTAREHGPLHGPEWISVFQAALKTELRRVLHTARVRAH